MDPNIHASQQNIAADASKFDRSKGEPVTGSNKEG